MNEEEKMVKQRCIRMYQNVVDGHNEQINKLSHDRDTLIKRITEMEMSIREGEVFFYPYYLIYMRNENAFLAERGYRTTDYRKAAHHTYTGAMNFINATNAEGKKDQPTAILVGCPDFVTETIGKQ